MSTECLIFVLRDESRDRDVFLWLREADVNANDGRGAAVFTTDRARAQRFASPTEATAFWRAQSRVKPLRDDGKPNRPLTAYTMMTQPAKP